MSKPSINRINSIEQWRILTNRISDNIGDPVDVTVTDAPNNIGINFANGNDLYTHPSDEQGALVAAVNKLIANKVKRTGDTISGSLNIQQSLGVTLTSIFSGAATFQANVTQNGTGNLSVTTTGTATISPTSTTTIGTLAQTTTLLGNVSAASNNQTVTLTPNGASGTVNIAPVTLTGTINNMSVGATTRSTGAFTTLTANDTTTLTKGTAATSTATGTLQVTGGAGFTGSVYCVGAYSDTVSSIGSGGNGDLTLTGIGTGIVKVTDNLTVTGSVTIDTGDIILSSGADVVQTITSGVAASTANVFATTNTATLNLGDNAAVNIGNASKNTAVRGTSSFAGVATFNNNITQVGAYTTSTGTGNISLNGNIVTTAKFSSDATNTDAETYTAKATSASTALTSLMTFAAATYASAEILVQAYDATSGTRQLTKVLLTYNGTDTSITEYGTVIAGAAQIATYSTDVNGGNIRLLVTPKSANAMTYKMVIHRLTT